MSTVHGPSHRNQTFLALGSATAVVFLCGLPYYRWFAHPSLFDDDFLRVGSLRRTDLSDALFRPFNEHMAPLFEAVSWLAWRGSGRNVLTLPLAFQVASFLAFGFTTLVLGLLIARELRSKPAALMGIVVFCLSSVSAETVLWYSACSFQWAAFATLSAWLCAAIGSDSIRCSRRAAWFVLSALSALCAPAFSAIGLLAGPLASVRILASVDHPSPILRRLGWSILPSLGTVAYLLICERFHFRHLVSESVHRNFEPAAALWAGLRAPSAVLIPSLIGVPSLAGGVPGWVLAAVSSMGLGAAIAWAWRSRDRSMILGGLALIVLGYGITYASRAQTDDLSIFEIQRYHLFPQIGLVWLIASLLAPRLRLLNLKPGPSLFAAGCLAAVLAIVQYPRMQAVSDRMFRYPEQSRILEATVRLERICESEGITLDQAILALEPIQTPWFPRRWPFNPLLNLFATGPAVARIPDSRVRQTLVDALSPDDREALFGGMEATRYREPAGSLASLDPAFDARVVTSFKVTLTRQGRIRVGGWPGQVDFEVSPEADLARALSLPGLRVTRPIQVWWSDQDGAWSATRSVWWKPDPDHPEQDWAVSLDRLPHWRPGKVRQLRLILRDPSPVELNAPRFLP